MINNQGHKYPWLLTLLAPRSRGDLPPHTLSQNQRLFYISFNWPPHLRCNLSPAFKHSDDSIIFLVKQYNLIALIAIIVSTLLPVSWFRNAHK